MSAFTEGETIIFARQRYEFVRDGCATDLDKCRFADEDAITVYRLDHRGKRQYNSTMCLPGDRCTAVDRDG